MVDKDASVRCHPAVARHRTAGLSPAGRRLATEAWGELALERDDVKMTLLGALLLAPFRPARPAHVGIVGPPQSGKSRLLAATRAWLDGDDARPGVADVSLQSSTLAGAIECLGLRPLSGVCFVDDVVVHDARTGQTLLQLLDAATRERTTVVFAGEVRAMGGELADRCVLLELRT